jgi:predicted  nucleic acid-binding Zn-ribbon protein
MGGGAMTAQEALAEIDKVNNRLRDLNEDLRHAMSDPGSEAVPQLQQEISEATARREWLREQLQQIQQSGG